MTVIQIALGDVVTIDRTSVGPEDIKIGQSYLGLDNIESGGEIIRVSSVKPGDLQSSKFEFDERHVLFGKLRPNLAKVARPTFSGICSTDILPLLPGPRIDRDYLAHFLLTPSAVKWSASRTSGANLPRLSPKILQTLMIPLPPLSEQRRIAAILDHAVELRSKRRRAAGLIDELDESTFSEYILNGTERITTTLGDVADIQTGPFGSLLHREDYVPGGIPLINPMHIAGGQIRVDPNYAISEEKYAELRSFALYPGDVVLGRRGEMGRAAEVLSEHGRLICGTGSMILRPKLQSITGAVLAQILATTTIRESLERRAQGVTMLNLNQSIVAETSIDLPPISVQMASGAIRNTLEKAKGLQVAHLTRLDELLKSAQLQAFSGLL